MKHAAFIFVLVISLVSTGCAQYVALEAGVAVAQVVTDNLKSASSKRYSPPNPAGETERDDRYICRMAVENSQGRLVWSSRDTRMLYVSEAKARQLDCTNPNSLAKGGVVSRHADATSNESDITRREAKDEITSTAYRKASPYTSKSSSITASAAGSKSKEEKALSRLSSYDVAAPVQISGLQAYARAALDIDLCALHQLYRIGDIFWNEIRRRGIKCTSKIKHDKARARALTSTELCEFLSNKKAINYLRERDRRGLACGVGSRPQVAEASSNAERIRGHLNWNPPSAKSIEGLSGTAEFRLGKMDQNSLCKYVSGEWSSGAFSKQQASDYALQNNIACGSVIASFTARNSAQDLQRLQLLEQRLAQLEAEKNAKQDSISQDTQSPSIRITTANSDGARGTISGTATDNTGIAEVLIDGQAVPLDSSGRFSTSTFIPSGGIDIQITAYDLKGLATTETVRLERTERTQQVSRLAAVNPLVGPKQKSSRDRAALIIGLEQYAAAPPADYASRDAQMFADYAREKLGIAPGNIKVLTDTEATRSGLLRALKVWLPQAVQPEKTDLYVFYAGHGMASDDGESAYIVPYGADTFLLEDTAISRERFYEEIGAAKPRTATFFFDNCYAGTTRSEERLLAQRPLSIKVQESPVPDNYLVFTAGESNQTAGVLDEVKHGRFSYFVFKGLEGEADANRDGKISAGELHKYVRESVGRFSAGAQTPTMLGDGSRWVLR